MNLERHGVPSAVLKDRAGILHFTNGRKDKEGHLGGFEV